MADLADGGEEENSRLLLDSLLRQRSYDDQHIYLLSPAQLGSQILYSVQEFQS